jgi:hypothetical protein
MKKRKKRKPDKLKRGGILQFSLEGKFIREYSSVREATKVLKIGYGAIHYCLTGLQKTGGNFQWRYKIDPNFDEGIFDIPPMINRWTFKLQPVVQYTMEGKFVKEYSSIKEAAEIFAVSVTLITQCARGKKRSARNYQWRVKKDVIKDGKIMDIEPVKSVSPLYFRAVCQFKPGGKFIREYPSIIDAAEKTNIAKTRILACVVKKNKSSGGFKWRLTEEVVKKKKDRKKMAIKRVKRDTSHYLRAVCQFKQDGTLVREYPSIYEASKKTNTTRSLIFSYATRKSKNRDGYLWRFKEDVVDKDGKISDIDTSKPVPYRYRRAVCQFGRDGKFLREYPSILDAAQKNRISKEYIYICTQKRIKTAFGYQWRYKDDPEFKNGITDIAPYEREKSRRRIKKKE